MAEQPCRMCRLFCATGGCGRGDACPFFHCDASEVNRIKNIDKLMPERQAQALPEPHRPSANPAQPGGLRPNGAANFKASSPKAQG